MTPTLGIPANSEATPTTTAASVTIAQKLIVTTEDKVFCCFVDYQKRHESRRAWWTPAGLALTTMVALQATSFHKLLGVSGALWEAVFWIVFVISLVLTVVWAIRAWRSPTSAEGFVKDLVLKGSVVEVQSEARIADMITL